MVEDCFRGKGLSKSPNVYRAEVNQILYNVYRYEILEDGTWKIACDDFRRAFIKGHGFGLAVVAFDLERKPHIIYKRDKIIFLICVPLSSRPKQAVKR